MRNMMLVVVFLSGCGDSDKDDDVEWGSGGWDEAQDTGPLSAGDVDADTDGDADADADADGSGGTDADGGGETDGATLFALNCSACHGADGSGVSGPDLNTAVPALSDADLMNVLQNGSGSMTAPTLTTSEEDVLFPYLRGQFGEFGGS